MDLSTLNSSRIVMTVRMNVTALADVWNEREHKHAAYHFIVDEVFRRVVREVRKQIHPRAEFGDNEAAQAQCRHYLARFGSGIRRIEKLNDPDNLLRLRIELFVPKRRQDEDEYAWFRREYCRPLAAICTSWANEILTDSPYDVWLRQVYTQFAASFRNLADRGSQWDELYLERNAHAPH